MLRQASPIQRERVIASLPADVADRLARDWWITARDAQLPPEGPWTYWTVLAGRGFGKTRTGSEWVLETARNHPGTIGHLVAPTAGDVEKVMLYGPAGIITVSPADFRPRYVGSKNKVLFPNGTVAYTFSAEEPERLRGPQCHWAYCDELAAWKRLQETWDQLQFGYRLTPTLGCLITTTPRPLPVVRELIGKFVRDGVGVVTGGSTYDNRANLSDKFFQEVVAKYEGTRLGRQELNAEILDDIPGALWTRAMIERNRVDAMPQMSRIVIAVDPSGCAGEDDKRSDEIGIVACGKGRDGKGYVLRDLSKHYSPEGWARAALTLYDELRADRIVAEKNFGGAMVESTIRTQRRNAPISLVTASRGKAQRAEPVAALYEQDRVKHVGSFPELEDQLCMFAPSGFQGGRSPDRADAAVWGLTEVMLGPEYTLLNNL